jgi:uncharacterized protein (DUF488 family)
MASQEEIYEIYTIGHSNKSASELVDLLRMHRIKLPVDVRSSPYSSYVPQFNRENLSLYLANSDIGYWYAGDCLGGRPKDPTCYKSGKIPEGKANYLEQVDYNEVAKRNWFKSELSHLISRSKEHGTVIMCSEEDPNRCHRHHLLAKTLSEKGMIIRHIRREGNLDEAKFDKSSKSHKYPLEKQKSLFDFV